MKELFTEKGIFFNVAASCKQYIHCILYRLLSSFLASRCEWASFLGVTFLTKRDLNQLSSISDERLLRRTKEGN